VRWTSFKYYFACNTSLDVTTGNWEKVRSHMFILMGMLFSSCWLSVMKQLLVFLSNISSQVNEISGNFIRSNLIRVSCVVVSCFHRTCETVLWVSHLLQHRQDLKSWPPFPVTKQIKIIYNLWTNKNFLRHLLFIFYLYFLLAIVVQSLT
jgi:hypothetical protein